MNIWVIRSGKKGEVEELAYNTGYALIGWAELGDISNLFTLGQIKLQVKQKQVVGNPARQFYKFKEVIGIGDICLLPLKQKSKGIVIGYFNGEYEHFPNNPELGRHGRKVFWMTNTISKEEIESDGLALRNIGGQQTVTKETNSETIQWVKDIVKHKRYGWRDEYEFEKYNWPEIDRTKRQKIESAFEKNQHGRGSNEDTSGFAFFRRYWVRPTIPKFNNENFPSKSIAKEFAVNGKKPSGGWHIEGACTILHNAGYILVKGPGNEDTDTIPVTEIESGEKVPDEFDYLINGETRIRAVIINYFLAPARGNHKNTVDINVSELHDMIGLEGQKHTVYDVLNRLEQRISGIKLLSKPYSEDSENESFTFKMNKFESDETPNENFHPTTNLILYGPPGTGKTYQTMFRAVKICLGEEIAKNLEGPENREELREEYSKLRKKGRIEFVTFHQSYSYQEFVEGLRPSTESNSNGDGNSSTSGFSLKPEPGIFKEICTDALESLEKHGKAALNYVLIIDEINRANISKVFGELITLLEEDKRIGGGEDITVKLPYTPDEKPFGIPRNLHIIGTMNTADRSIALIDTALRRRFTFEELEPNFDFEVIREIKFKDANGLNLSDYLKQVNVRIEWLIDREHRIGHAKFLKCENEEQVEEVFRKSIIPLLAEYFFEDWEKIAKVLEVRELEKVDEETYEGCFLTKQKLVPNFFETKEETVLDGDEEKKWSWTVNKEFKFKKLVKKNG